MRLNKFCLIVLSILVGFNVACENNKEGCKDPISINYDPEAEDDNGTCQYGGTGGSTIFVLSPEHHLQPIFSSASYPDSAFIKFNATSFPGDNPALYDLIAEGEDGEDHVHVPDMKPGKYYVFMTGWDTTINERVIGGIPIVVTATSGEVDFSVPVTE